MSITAKSNRWCIRRTINYLEKNKHFSKIAQHSMLELLLLCFVQISAGMITILLMRHEWKRALIQLFFVFYDFLMREWHRNSKYRDDVVSFKQLNCTKKSSITWSSCNSDILLTSLHTQIVLCITIIFSTLVKIVILCSMWDTIRWTMLHSYW